VIDDFNFKYLCFATTVTVLPTSTPYNASPTCVAFLMSKSFVLSWKRRTQPLKPTLTRVIFLMSDKSRYPPRNTVARRLHPLCVIWHSVLYTRYFSFGRRLTTASVLQRPFRVDSVDISERKLYETLTHDVHRSAIKHYEEFFGYWPQKIGDQKLPIFDDFATQWQL